MKVKDIVQIFESFAPKGYQEDYDNSGLSVGDPNMEVSGILCCIDITMDVLDEAVSKKANLIVSHHPLIFRGLKSITGQNYIEEIIIKAIKNDIAFYSGHTNFDNIENGVNKKIADILGLKDCCILDPLKNSLVKLATFVPVEHVEKVRQALFEAGAGTIGKYDNCSYVTEGIGSFRGGEESNPFVGNKGEIHYEKEVRIETILPSILKSKVIKALLQTHPYEEVAYDIYPLENEFHQAGAGMIGLLPEPVSLKQILEILKNKFNAQGIRYAGQKTDNISKIALCGGSGSFLIPKALQHKADVFITGDIKYHQFFDAGKDLIIIDIGHFESEQFTKDIFYEVLKKKIPKFAVHLSEVKTNPVKYYS